jgi:hypothetical protein
VFEVFAELKCPFVVKMDDDVYLRVPKFLDWLMATPPKYSHPHPVRHRFGFRTLQLEQSAAKKGRTQAERVLWASHGV